MPKFVLSAAAHLIANAVGLMLANILLSGFSISVLGIVIVTVVFTVVSMVLLPILRKVSEKKAPQLLGGLSLIVIFFGLWITELLVSSFTMGGFVNHIAATIIVWIGALIAAVLVPKYLITGLNVPKK
ncbi:superfamily IV 4 TMS phage holin [Shimia isoporae]|uniref:Superfamily IV 4 TMS phage holin n=1 Tax=Shimia isoporae TaxID=647720 RepID=A0A4R1N1V9_9RHOB|nr:phage holin family protein [Shimia isoporae]TCK99956.1 superfamily IV 4 TMS phage holin [Shimia isoporae]